jgi:type IX secretion system PorP/SprF family membrane protein
MRSTLLICVFGLMNVAARAQYVPNNGQAYQLASLYNPAFSGIEEFTDLKLSYRNQWSGFGANAPKFLNLSLNTRLKQPLDLKYNSMRMGRPSIVQPEKLPRRKRVIHGLSINIFQSKFGAISQVGGALGYSLNYPISKKFRIAAGLSSVIDNRKIQLGDLTFEKPDPFYQHLLNSPSSQLDVSLRAGFLLYAGGFYFGASYLSFLNQSIESSGIALEELFYKASFQTGFSLDLSPSVTVKPSMLVYLQADNKLLIDYNIKTYFDSKGWIGVTYRNSKNGIGLLGFNATPFLSAAYSYEVSFGGLQQFTDSSHELMLIFKINNFKKLNSAIW